MEDGLYRWTRQFLYNSNRREQTRQLIAGLQAFQKFDLLELHVMQRSHCQLQEEACACVEDILSGIIELSMDHCKPLMKNLILTSPLSL